MKKIGIVGAGNGGQAMAAHLALKGNEVKIFDVFKDTVDKLNSLGGIEIEGQYKNKGFGKIKLASTNIEDVVKGAEIVLVVLPSIYHADMAKRMAHYLEDGQWVGLFPHACMGAVEFAKVLKDNDCTADINLFATSTLLFACRAVGVGKVNIAGQKNKIGAATLPASKNKKAMEIFKDIIPELAFEGDVIKTSLDNINCWVHPAPTILNSGRIESKIPFEFYDDMTPSQTACIDALDLERIKIGEAYGIKLNSLVYECKTPYNGVGENMFEVLQDCNAHKGIKGPTTLRSRYIMEDVPYSLTACQSLAKIAGVKTQLIDAFTIIGRTLVPEIEEGRTIKNLGLEGMSKEDLIKMVRQ